jgi:hypothetical protein
LHRRRLAERLFADYGRSAGVCRQWEDAFAHRAAADGGTVIGNQSNQRPGASMGDKSPKSKDRQKKQDAKEKGQKVAAAALKVAVKQAPSKTRT